MPVERWSTDGSADFKAACFVFAHRVASHFAIRREEKKNSIRKIFLVESFFRNSYANPNKMIFKLPDMKTVYLLVAGSLLVQPVFSHGGDKVTAVWIDFDGTIATNEAFETLALAAYDSMTKEQVAKYPPWR